MIEAAGRVMARVATPSASNLVTKRLRTEGVDIRLNTRLSSIAGSDGRVSACILDSGEAFAADLVIVGIGAVPNHGLAVRWV
ncbi:FAD-dependent oxidoreductase [Bradyrhizobium diazoefficiens]|nr:FAD-dependent oxidoreductase [Bradyrhizobium diazoefficiens]MBR0978236.1 FAD-dependent oxidoreductase [Bradyrhizobium diazoefficiens]MBR1006167.1 FAD-dependent oxidoreductase [Bradyrhizobium diazoefficiens]MBR1014219.1 FAD-dependent oxidoreductase [Bradyrhizobium diazoefficiens]MBR1050356.1 FAD-dependent oxidoreductase [Bradyrhizobium diazoefficiens]